MKLARARPTLGLTCSVFLIGLTGLAIGGESAPAAATQTGAGGGAANFLDAIPLSWHLWLDLTSYLFAAGFAAAILHLLRTQRRLQAKISAGHDKETQTEKQLARNRCRLRAILDNSVVGIALARTDGSYLEVNESFTRMFGYSREEMGDLSNISLNQPDDIASSRQHLEAMVAGKSGFRTIDQRFVRKDGHAFWISISTAPIYGEHGEIESVICITQDINERKLAEERLQRILSELPIATLVVDATRRITYRSAKFEMLFGYTPSDVAALHDWLPLAFPDPAYLEQARKTGYEIVATSRQTGHASGPAELRVRCKDGSSKTVEFHYVDLMDQGIWMMNDVTEQNDMEASMRAINDHLMARLGEISGLQEQLRKQAMHDSLTGLFNRRYLDEMLERELARSKREGLPLTVMMLDIDFFKKLNDTYGHQAGDEVLRRLADLLRQNSRAEDIPCRYGGEEFLLVLPNMGRVDALARAEQWRQEFEALRIVFGQMSMRSSISIGIATFPEHGETRTTLIEAADKALYVAKHNGRNRVEISPD
jgi:diguanylate cyclase (GGDEF)-like protein/PAS domain S-box-containing protein